MSNNPFLKQKNTNNRFNTLISDTQTTASNNTFLQKKQKNIDVDTKVSNKTQPHMDVVTKVSNKKQMVLEEEFPLLCESHSTLIENTLKFTDAVNTVIAEAIVIATEIQENGGIESLPLTWGNIIRDDFRESQPSKHRRRPRSSVKGDQIYEHFQQLHKP